jgi:hypothetical protein
VGSARGAAQRVSGAVFAGVAEHRVDAGFGVERARGPAGGVEAAVHPGGSARWDIALRVIGGSLSAVNAGAISRDLGEIGLSAGAQVHPWLSLRAGLTRRVYGTAIARQGWTLVDAGAEVRVAFLGGAVRAVAGGAWLPVVSVNGLPRPDLAFSATTGLEYRLGRATVDLRYHLERCDFPAGVSTRRLEQLSALTLRARVGLAGGT